MSDNKLSIAVVGTGISGMTVAYLLKRKHNVTVFEANDYIGGHTNTIDVETQNGSLAVDTGFIVYNEKTYPNFIRLLDQLGIKSQPTTMGFSVSEETTGLEYSGNSLSSMFAQKSNLFRPSFYRMIRGILRFNREAPLLLEENNTSISLGEYLESNKYPEEFVNHFIIPMGSAIWSTVSDRMMEFPAKTFIRFFRNHGLLSLNNRPEWRVIKGGSREYVKKLVEGFRDDIRLNEPVSAIRRLENDVELTLKNGDSERFDKVVIAAHSDQALKMLSDPSKDEGEILSEIPYEENIAVLHTDTSLLPKREKAWSSWNYHIWDTAESKVSLTYNMNILQTLKSDQVFCVTLNDPGMIDPYKIIKVIKYHHPQFTLSSMYAQKKKGLINGIRNTYYCGAYWRYGFHEDGVLSALDVGKHFGVGL